MHIYLDYNATTPFLPQVINVVTKSMENDWGNASSSHFYGKRASNAVTRAKMQVKDLINANDLSNILYLSGGTEANHLAIYSAIFQKGDVNTRRNQIPHVIISSIEHPAIVKPCLAWEEMGWCQVSQVRLRKGQGVPHVDDVVDAIKDNTVLISCMLVNNETGCVTNVAEIVKRVKQRKPSILVHTDAAQAIGKLPLSDVDVERLGVDFMTLVGHKMYAPRIGVLYSRNPDLIVPMIHGGGQERGLRSGTENVAQIAGFGEACHLIQTENDKLVQHCTDLLVYLEENVQNIGQECNVEIVIHGKGDRRASNVSNFSPVKPDLPSWIMCEELEKRGIIVGRGSACHSGVGTPSQVLLAMGVASDVAMNALRVSLGYKSTRNDVDAFLAAFKDILSTFSTTSKL